MDLRTVIFNKKASAKRSRRYQPRTSEGTPHWGRAVHTSAYGARLSSVPSGDCYVSPATRGGWGHSDIQRVSLSASAWNRSSSERLATSKNCLKQLDWPSPARSLLQGTELVVQSTPEASLERLVPLVYFSAAWKLLPNVSQWVLRTVEKGYKIQFGSRPPLFNGVFPNLVGPEQALVMEQEVDTLLRKQATKVVPTLDRESGF